MDREGVGKVCLALPSVTLDHPFGEEHDAYRIGGKIFAMVGERGGISFKVSDIAYAVLTETGPLSGTRPMGEPAADRRLAR